MKLISKILLKILLICQLVILISCGWTKYQVHRSAFIHNQHEITEFNGRIYSYKSILKDGTFVEETNHNVGHMTTNEEYLFVEVNKYYKEKDLIFNKFLLERYLNNINFKKEKVINDVSKMKKDYRHLFYIDNKYMTESTFLKKMFDINVNL